MTCTRSRRGRRKEDYVTRRLVRSWAKLPARANRRRYKNSLAVCPVICLPIRFATFHLPSISLALTRSFCLPLFYFYSWSTAAAAARRRCNARRVLARVRREGNAYWQLHYLDLFFICYPAWPAAFRAMTMEPVLNGRVPWRMFTIFTRRESVARFASDLHFWIATR